MKYYKLDYYIDKLKGGEHFSLARYGDGELYCMWGRQGRNSNKCRYSSELKQALLDSMKVDIMHGLQRVLPIDEKKILAQYPDVEWYETEFLSEAVAKGELYPLIEQLRNMKVVIIGNESIYPIVHTLKAYNFVEVPPYDAYEERERVIKDILLYKTPNIVFLFSCGMAANAFIAQLHGKVDGWLIDVGHIWDPFVGNMSRCDLEGKTLEDINKNLCPKE